jgi:phytoene synthase
VTPELAAGYAECARLTRAYGTTYYWGAALLPSAQRRHVYAIYALCRLADDIVDADGATTVRASDTARQLTAFRAGFDAALDGDPPDATLAAIAHTVRETGIERECFDRFFGAMALDLTVAGYRTWADLCGYMEGSAAVIGEMMLPVLQPLTPDAKEPARALGFAFQLTNFLRDVGEDLDRGRVYLPADDLARFGADPWRRVVDQPWREVMAFEIARNRELYALARTGVAMLPPASARCVGTALDLYSRILERIESRDYDVFSGRARVPTWRKAVTAASILVAGPRQVA